MRHSLQHYAGTRLHYIMIVNWSILVMNVVTFHLNTVTFLWPQKENCFVKCVNGKNVRLLPAAS